MDRLDPRPFCDHLYKHLNSKRSLSNFNRQFADVKVCCGRRDCEPAVVEFWRKAGHILRQAGRRAELVGKHAEKMSTAASVYSSSSLMDGYICIHPPSLPADEIKRKKLKMQNDAADKRTNGGQDDDGGGSGWNPKLVLGNFLDWLYTSQWLLHHFTKLVSAA